MQGKDVAYHETPAVLGDENIVGSFLLAVIRGNDRLKEHGELRLVQRLRRQLNVLRHLEAVSHVLDDLRGAGWLGGGGGVRILRAACFSTQRVGADEEQANAARQETRAG